MEWIPTERLVSGSCATPPTTGLFAEKPLLASIENVTVPPGVLEELTFAVKLTLPPEEALQGTFTLEVVRVMDDGAGPPPTPPVDPPPQPAKPRNKEMAQAIVAPRAKRLRRSRGKSRKRIGRDRIETTGIGQKGHSGK
jgi:hypothetical protein